MSEERSSFLKKRTKKLLFPAPAPARPAMARIFVQAERQKSFGSFLQKRTSFFYAFFLLSGCAAPPLTLYTLADQAGETVSPPLGARPVVIEVAHVSIPDDFDTEDILVHDRNVLRRSKTGRWASRLSLEITSLITRNLAARYPQALITDERQLTSPAERLLVSITRLDITAQGQAQISADWQIVPENSTAGIGRARAQFSVSGPVATDQDVVDLEVELITKLAGAISLPLGM